MEERMNEDYIYPDHLGNVYFDDPLIRDIYTATAGNMQISMPYMNVLERVDHYEVKVLSPGVDYDNLEISIEGDELLIVAKGNNQSQSKKGFHRWREFAIPGFVRSVKLPETVNTAQTPSYRLDKGVLTVYLMKH